VRAVEALERSCRAALPTLTGNDVTDDVKHDWIVFPTDGARDLRDGDGWRCLACSVRGRSICVSASSARLVASLSCCRADVASKRQQQADQADDPLGVSCNSTRCCARLGAVAA
jgi:hypothetical protein